MSIETDFVPERPSNSPNFTKFLRQRLGYVAVALAALLGSGCDTHQGLREQAEELNRIFANQGTGLKAAARYGPLSPEDSKVITIYVPGPERNGHDDKPVAVLDSNGLVVVKPAPTGEEEEYEEVIKAALEVLKK